MVEVRYEMISQNVDHFEAQDVDQLLQIMLFII